MITRGITKEDYDAIVSVMDRWWGGPAGTKALPIFFYEFGEHALIVESEGEMVGFLLGFVTATEPRTAYVHLVGIDPRYRRRGVARALYDEFERRGRTLGARRLKCITTTGNHGSVAFHAALGFDVENVPDYAGPGRSRVVFSRALGDARSRDDGR